MNKEWSVLNKLTRRQDEIYHRCAVNAGISDTKFWILYAICESGGALCQNAICQDWFCSKQTVSTAVAGLERDGILHLQFAAGSKKQKNLQLTAKGELFCDKHIRSVLNAECRALSSLPEPLRQAYLSTREKLLEVLEQELQKA